MDLDDAKGGVVFGKAHRELMKDGELGRAIVQQISGLGTPGSGSDIAMDMDGLDMGSISGGSYRCTFDLLVFLDNTPAFTARAHAWVPASASARFVPGGTVVAVRVDPSDHANVAIDLSIPPPQVRIAAGGDGVFSAATILAVGSPCQVVIQKFEPYGMKNAEGVDMYDFTFTVIPEGAPPREGGAINPAPPEALPLMFPGSKLPAKFDPNHPEATVIDWTAALAGDGTLGREVVITQPLCPNCGAPVSAGVKVCTYCHADTRATPPS